MRASPRSTTRCWPTARLPLGGALARIPLQVHASYSLDEIFAGFERNSKGGVSRVQIGAVRMTQHHTDVLLVTLEKSEQHYTPTTLYDDYPISPTRFHWESQSTCHEGAKAGKRYLSALRAASAPTPAKSRPPRRDDALPQAGPCVLPRPPRAPRGETHAGGVGPRDSDARLVVSGNEEGSGMRVARVQCENGPGTMIEHGDPNA